MAKKRIPPPKKKPPRQRRILRIHRPKWARGNGSSKLQNTGTGKMCCLGFDALQLCGAKRKDIANKYTPEGTPSIRWHRWLLTSRRHTGKRINSDDARELLSLNDRPGDPEEREWGISRVFAKHGIKVVFYGRRSQ